MKNIKLGILGVFYAISTAIFLVLIGSLYFREKMNNYESVGFVLGIISLVLLSRFYSE